MELFIFILGLVALVLHTTVSLREAQWLPKWLGQGLPESHWAIHLRVALANGYYCFFLGALFLGLIIPTSWPVRSILAIFILFTLMQVVIRGRKAYQGFRS